MVDQCAVVCRAAIYNGRLILAKAPERQCEAKLYNHTKEARGAGGVRENRNTTWLRNTALTWPVEWRVIDRFIILYCYKTNIYTVYVTIMKKHI